jgi:hypothetical protein
MMAIDIDQDLSRVTTTTEISSESFDMWC